MKVLDKKRSPLSAALGFVNIVQLVGSALHAHPCPYMMRLCASFRASAPILMPRLFPNRIAWFASSSRPAPSLIAPTRLSCLRREKPSLRTSSRAKWASARVWNTRLEAMSIIGARLTKSPIVLHGYRWKRRFRPSTTRKQLAYTVVCKKKPRSCTSLSLTRVRNSGSTARSSSWSSPGSCSSSLPTSDAFPPLPTCEVRRGVLYMASFSCMFVSAANSSISLFREVYSWFCHAEFAGILRLDRRGLDGSATPVPWEAGWGGANETVALPLEENSTPSGRGVSCSPSMRGVSSLTRLSKSGS
mmetsp:Transcript_59372/g.139875  ORF Transcript_59372/g.139875 Transcript_59372/m.139875 type:complete len:302 (+) Transcript_59372:542-1447(+)